jgi:hypothetical protein
MEISHDDIQEFKKIYREEFDEELSDAEAEQRARQLLTFYEIILHILLKEQAGKPDNESSPLDAPPAKSKVGMGTESAEDSPCT